MLSWVQIKNIALIETLEVEFSKGLNILSGETGAGKSIVIDAISFVLGERAPKELLRSGEELAEVSAFFVVTKPENIDTLEQMGVSAREDSAVLLYRSLSAAGKMVCKVNGKQVTVSMLKEISALLMDMHGQHEHQSLLDASQHIKLLDRFCGPKTEDLKMQLATQFKAYREVAKKIKSFSGGDNDRQAKMDMYAFLIDEIKKANIKKGEEETLLLRRKQLSNSEKLSIAANKIMEYLLGDGGAQENLGCATAQMEIVAELDAQQEEAQEQLNELFSMMEDFTRTFSRYKETLAENPDELEKVEERLDTIFRLKKKHGGTVDSLLAFYDETLSKLEWLQNSEEELQALGIEKKKQEKEMLQTALMLSKERKAAGARLQEQMQKTLQELGMKQAVFVVNIDKKEELGLLGFDQVEFLIAPNQGEPLKPLAKIASGGEVSRVMLAAKNTLAAFDNIETFIFDEIDTGVSGRTAHMVAEKLSQIAKTHQILCITHLPQIAAMGDAHFLIEKQTKNERTFTNMFALTEEASVAEIARLLGGAKTTENALKAAAELKELGKKS